MIPKVIHYIWFGGKAKPNKIVQQIEQWRSILPDYQIKEWNETNYDIKNINVKYVQEALQENMWAFVSDYVRLDILNREGGIYLDTDVEILKSFDELLKNKAFIGRESKYAFSTAVIASEPKQRWLQQLLEDYSRRTFLIDKNVYDKTPNSKYILSFLLRIIILII
ncbi:glycosyltransferase family 32 protein [Leuconostoc fallax]|uniref:glycosyltransferase family 32 protein n=1 Tax=Leuconostoc fallax TaxID=1251 RepID=UPI00020D9A83|nr:glycosyltransferase [Leuconostoc fallax]